MPKLFKKISKPKRMPVLRILIPHALIPSPMPFLEHILFHLNNISGHEQGIRIFDENRPNLC